MEPVLLCAQITGLSLVAVSAAMLVRPRGMMIMFERLLENPPILFVFGLVQLIGGLALVLTQNALSGANLTLVLALVGWWLLIRGGMLMFVTPEALLSLLDSIELPKYHFLSNGLSLLIGIYLTYTSFFPILVFGPLAAM
jgi:hypothetical protein